MNRFRSSKGVSLVRLDFWAPGDMRDWVDREACKAGLHRSEFLRRMIQHEMMRNMTFDYKAGLTFIKEEAQ